MWQEIRTSKAELSIVVTPESFERARGIRDDYKRIAIRHISRQQARDLRGHRIWTIVRETPAKLSSEVTAERKDAAVCFEDHGGSNTRRGADHAFQGRQLCRRIDGRRARCAVAEFA